MNEYYEKYRGSGLWSEWVKIGKCDNCNGDVKCSLEYYERR